MQNSQDAINPHLLLHTKAGPEPPDSHNYYRIGPQQQQQHILGEASYLHYTPQPPPPSLTPPSRSSHGRGAGRASIEARYRALMRNMLMYQQMRIRATSTPYIEPQGPQLQQQQQEEATLFSSFSLPPHHHHHHLEYSLPSSFDLPPPAEPTMLDAAVSQAELVAAPTSSPPLQDPYQHHHQQIRSSDPFDCTNTYNDEEEAVTVPTAPGQSPKPSRIARGDPGGGGGGGSGRRRKPTHGGKPSDGSAASGSKTSSSRISRSKPRTRSKPRPRPRPIASAVQFALEELTTSTSSSSSSRFVQQQQHYHHDDHSAEPLGGEAVRRNQGDGDGNQIDQDADDDDHGMKLDHVEDIHARATRDLVLECFVSSMTDGLG